MESLISQIDTHKAMRLRDFAKSITHREARLDLSQRSVFHVGLIIASSRSGKMGFSGEACLRCCRCVAHNNAYIRGAGLGGLSSFE
jgi:hypothetical protein